MVFNGRRNAQKQSDEKRVPRSSMLRLAKQQKFEEIATALQNDTAELEQWLFHCSNNHASLRTLRSETPLHLILIYRPPIAVVDLLICHLRKLDPRTVPEEATDDHGRTPLHVAAASGCDKDVICRLLNGVSAVMPAVTKDLMGRFPLHWALSNWRRAGGRSTAKQSAADDNMVLMITELVKAYPMGAAIKDYFGQTALDLARSNKVDSRIILLLEHLIKIHGPAHNTGTMSATETSDDAEDIFLPRGMSELNLEDGYNDDTSSLGSGGVSTIKYGHQKLTL